jgi:DNA primase
MQTFPMDFAKQLKSQVDIVSVASEYVRLRRFGNRYSGLCPFHNEKTPSFSIYTDHQWFKCYGCDASGDVLKFVMMIEGLTFWEALKKLADQNGIPLPKQSLASDEDTRLRAALFEMHEIAAEHFRANLAGPNGAVARAYIERRGVAQDAVRQFGLGLAEGSGRALLRVLEQRGFKPDLLETSGLVAKRDDGSSFYDRFRNRLMFPIHSESGKIIAFGGRALDPADKAKYLNSPETKIYKKSTVLYNLHRAKQTAMQTDRIVLVEGYMDVIGASEAGVKEVVATCGTALTVEQIRAMKRHSANLHLNFDPDAAGANAAERSIKLLLDENVRVRIVDFQGIDLDPDEFAKTGIEVVSRTSGDYSKEFTFAHDAALFRERIDKAQPYFYWLADRARARFNMRDPQGRMDAFQFLVPAIQGLNEKMERDIVANDLASYLGVEAGMVRDHFRKMATDRGADRAPAPRTDPARATDRILLPLLVDDSEARAQLIGELRGLPALLEGPTAGIYEALFAAVDAGEPISFNMLHERLDPALQERLSAIVLEEGAAHTPTLEDGLACVAALRREGRETMRRELKARIKSAEREGRLHEALELAHQLQHIG